VTVPPHLPAKPQFVTLAAGAVLGRIHLRSGPHPAEWYQMRSYGPLPQGRFDQQPPPPHADPQHQVMYVARHDEGISLLTVCVAEAFAPTRTVDTRYGSPHFTVFATAAPLRVADIGHSTNDRAATQSWARTQCSTTQPPHGVLYPSAQAHHLGAAQNLCLWGPQASAALPDSPDVTIALNDPAILGALQDTCHALGYALIA